MTAKHTKFDRLRRVAAATFAESHQNPEMLAFGIDGDPKEALAPQLVVSPGFSINCYFQGSGELNDHTGRHRIRPGTVVLRIPGIEQHVSHDEHPRYAKAWCGMSRQRGDGLIKLGLLNPKRTCWDCSDLATAMRLHDRLLADCEEWPKPTGCELWRRIIEWLEALQPSKKINDPIQRAADLLLRDLSGQQTVPAIAEQVGMAYGTLRRYFNERFGMSPAAWQLHHRMRQACLMLEGTTVALTAKRLGYSSPFAFSTQFRRSMGESPRAFQQRIRRHT